MSTEKVVAQDQSTRTVETWDGDVLLHTRVESLLPAEPSQADRLAAVEDAVDQLILAALEG